MPMTPTSVVTALARKSTNKTNPKISNANAPALPAAPKASCMRTKAIRHVTALAIVIRTNFRGDLAAVSGRRGCGDERIANDDGFSDCRNRRSRNCGSKT